MITFVMFSFPTLSPSYIKHRPKIKKMARQVFERFERHQFEYLLGKHVLVIHSNRFQIGKWESQYVQQHDMLTLFLITTYMTIFKKLRIVHP